MKNKDLIIHLYEALYMVIAIVIIGVVVHRMDVKDHSKQTNLFRYTAPTIK